MWNSGLKFETKVQFREAFNVLKFNLIFSSSKCEVSSVHTRQLPYHYFVLFFNLLAHCECIVFFKAWPCNPIIEKSVHLLSTLHALRIWLLTFLISLIIFVCNLNYCKSIISMRADGQALCNFCKVIVQKLSLAMT